jgi:hypothetical protein
VGAATWGNGTTGVKGSVSIVNSLIGTTVSDQVSSGGVVALTNGDYVVRSASWDKVDGGALSNAGAVTFGSGTTGITGSVSAVNSVIGTTASSGLGIPLDDSANRTFVCPFPTAEQVSVGLTFAQMPYAMASDQNLTVISSFITTALNNGVSVSLQANDDITVSSTLSFSGGNLSLSSGRSTFLNADITTGGANLTVVANDVLASGVVDAERSAGSAVLSIADGVTINSGRGNISLSLLDGAGKTNTASGDITFGVSSQLIASGLGNISVTAQENNIVFTQDGLFRTANGNLLMIAGRSILANTNSSAPVFQSTGFGILRFVVDNLNSTSPNIGSGIFDMPLATFTSSSPVSLYTTTLTSGNIFPATINGTAYTAGVTTDREVYATYFPDGTATSPFTVFYKAAAPTSSSGLSVAQSNITTTEYDRSAAESFWLWRTDLFGPYLSWGRGAPLYTHALGDIILPSLVVKTRLNPELQIKKKWGRRINL